MCESEYGSAQLSTYCMSLQSYAGKYVPAIGYKIHTENMNNPAVKINLKGLATGDGWSDPENVRKRASVQASCVRVVLVKFC